MGLTVGGWTVGRAASLWGGASAILGLGTAAGVVAWQVDRLRWPRATALPVFRPAVPRVRPRPAPAPRGPAMATLPDAASWAAPGRSNDLLQLAVSRYYFGGPQVALRRATYAAMPVERSPADAAPFVAPAPARDAGAAFRRWTASAYLFVRPGSGQASLAAGGQLGGSQAAARVTYQLNPQGPVRTAAAARLYTPAGGKGAEAAVGLDWHPLPAVPLRLSVERRIALDRSGRNAWSAYAAGGFYREGAGGRLVLDGYAQAGVVGTAARDLFVDGAVRAGRRFALGRNAATLGAGMWGAAQPGVSRLDAGPRLSIVVPMADHSLTLAVEGRLRVAGRARPGSGAAMTLALDL